MSIRKANAKFNSMNSRMEKLSLESASGFAKGNSLSSLSKRRYDRIYGTIIRIKSNRVYFELQQKLDGFRGKSLADEKYFIRFMSDRSTITLQHEALDYFEKHQIADFFFPNLFTHNLKQHPVGHLNPYSHQS